MKKLELMIFFIILIVYSGSITNAVGVSYTVIIPKGAANPDFDPQLTQDRTEERYVPTKLIILVNDTVTWLNEDIEKHTVTSGESSGRFGFTKGEMGKPDGLFDSGLFEPSKTWSHTFTNAGTFQYFCTIHPWMYGAVIVEADIPDYPHDAEGNKITLPVMTLSSDKKYHNGVYWSPIVIKTGEQVTFTNDFFDKNGFTKLHLLEYDFVLIQNGKEIHRSLGYSENGSDVKYFVFLETGPLTIRFENMGADKNSYVEFNTIVYPGKSDIPVDVKISSDKIQPVIYQVVMFGLIGAAAVMVGTMVFISRRRK
ncbi:MAG TPA: plastocyanin/azurin family copper-binding protein [Nitrosopumilaceae archaeon]|nr:plastocyanin/azurin family copper-binding protein [Nitrosopumilaceae archaeon]